VFDLNQLQKEMREWQAHNFPNRPSYIPLLGIVEEFGESCEPDSDWMDAICDMIIYLADYSNSLGINLQEQFDPKFWFGDKEHQNEIVIWLGKLSHSHIKLDQKIRMNEQHREVSEKAIYNILNICYNAVEADGQFSFFEELKKVWTQVRQRDWIKFPKNGRTE
jgi:hypothetical protein